MSREDVVEDERPQLAFYANEFHNYGTIAWAEKGPRGSAHSGIMEGGLER